jgi:hypothetical protein
MAGRNKKGDHQDEYKSHTLSEDEGEDMGSSFNDVENSSLQRRKHLRSSNSINNQVKTKNKSSLWVICTYSYNLFN